MPLLTVPIWMTFPAAFNLYWLTFSMTHCLMINSFRFKSIRTKLGVPDFLAGTKFERMNAGTAVVLEKPKVFAVKPTKKMLEDKAGAE